MFFNKLIEIFMKKIVILSVGVIALSVHAETVVTDTSITGTGEAVIVTIEPVNDEDTDNTKNYATAKRLREEGAALQKAGKFAEAVEKYKESLMFYPDKALEAHIKVVEQYIVK